MKKSWPESRLNRWPGFLSLSKITWCCATSRQLVDRRCWKGTSHPTAPPLSSGFAELVRSWWGKQISTNLRWDPPQKTPDTLSRAIPTISTAFLVDQVEVPLLLLRPECP